MLLRVVVYGTLDKIAPNHLDLYQPAPRSGWEFGEHFMPATKLGSNKTAKDHESRGGLLVIHFDTSTPAERPSST
jgi:hypothetical protein